jgi:short-subunit dehydrogenase
VRYLPLDLANPRSVDSLARKLTDVELLVNNGGASPVGPAEEAPAEKARELFQLNLFGALRLTQAVLPGMRARGHGTIVFIGSMRSEAPSPFSSLYSASKAAVRSFAECLRMEVRGFGVRVSTVAPWHIRTTLSQEKLVAPRSPYAEAVRRVKESRDRMIATAPEPRVVAKAVMKIVRSRRPRAFYSVGHNAGLQAFLIRHMPRGLVEASSARRFKLTSPR